MSTPNEAIAQFVEQAERSFLLSSDEARETLSKLSTDKSVTAESLSAQLVEKKHLTAFQAEQLLAGRGEECIVAGRYRILDKLGAGGMGTVYQAQDMRLDRIVAIKVLPAHLVSDPGAIARFQREAKALAKVSHPAIVQAHDAGEDRGRHFLVMEYVDGNNLNLLLKERGRLSPTQAVEFVHQAALGLQHAHDRGLVHRDLKPSNLILTAGRQIKILDLGLARFLQDQLGDAGLTREGTGLGTPNYMAPEQFGDARHVDHRADIYALGCTLYHLLAGRVPFPGSSLSEKAQAHETQEPEPLEALCPDITAGLILVVQRMMAKKAADRFQTAAELAEALAPYLGGSSASLPQLRRTTQWQGSQLSFTLARRPSRRRRTAAVVLGAAALAVLLTASGVLVPRLLPARSTRSSNDQPDPSTTSPTVTAEPQESADPNVLTVSQDPKDGGQFRTINEALAKVKPGQTIRVLDDSTYNESLLIDEKSRHEGLTVESTRRATIAVPHEGSIGVGISNVPRVTVRGFRVRMGNRQTGFGMVVTGASPGAVLEAIECVCRANSGAGLHIEQVDLDDDDEPVLVQSCKFSGTSGITVVAKDLQTRRPLPCRRIIIRDNMISDLIVGIVLVGQVSDVQVCGNRAWNCMRGCILLQDLFEKSTNILIANNTLKGAKTSLSVEEPAGGLQGIELRNNLILADRGPDLAIVGKDQARIAGWRIEQNWRSVQPPAAQSPGAGNWVSAARDRVGPVQLMSLDPNSFDFLRPAKDSPLATEGAGKTDPRLPSYVGAIPPEGVSPWDWDRTWRMPKDAQLLTVSKDAKDGGQFRTINDALKAAKPWATVRVLDNATYEDVIVIEDSTRFAGVTLEALKRATLAVGKESSGSVGVAIRNVPMLCVKGFRLREIKPRDGTVLVVIEGRVGGIRLEDLDIQSPALSWGITLSNVKLAANERPLVIRGCSIRTGNKGIGIRDSNGIGVHDNRILGSLEGVELAGTIAAIQITGNVIGNTRFVAIDVEDLGPSSNNLLVANNTLFNSGSLFRVWDYAPFEDFVRGQFELRNNLLIESNLADIIVLRSARGADDPERVPGAKLLKLWRFEKNMRTGGGLYASDSVPLAPTDTRLEQVNLLSRDPTHSDFFRPAADSPLATGGAGKDDPSFPSYVGAVPPKGTPAWDWGKTWQWRNRGGAPTAGAGSNDAAAGDKRDSKK